VRQAFNYSSVGPAGQTR